MQTLREQGFGANKNNNSHTRRQKVSLVTETACSYFV